MCGKMARQTDIENIVDVFMQLFVENVPESAPTINPTEYFSGFLGTHKCAGHVHNI
jgi:hypothetical protein